jgi:transglutaminase-like putative cysteine protease
MRYRIVHQTTYTYEQSVRSCQNEAHLIPRNSPDQRCLRYRVDIDPKPGCQTEREDFFGNRVIYFAIDEAHERLAVTATSEVSVEEKSSLSALDIGEPWQAAVRRLREERTAAHLQACQYLPDSPMITVTPEIRRYAAFSFRKRRPVAEVLHDLMARIHRDFTYEPGSTTVATPLSAVLKHRRGVCQDFAHFAIACIRSRGIPARYVSGYLETEPLPGQTKLQGADASHAWFSAYDPTFGWIDYDPTNNQLPTIRHITTAWGRDYSDVTPLKGVIYGGGQHHAEVAVDVVALEEMV